MKVDSNKGVNDLIKSTIGIMERKILFLSGW